MFRRVTKSGLSFGNKTEILRSFNYSVSKNRMVLKMIRTYFYEEIMKQRKQEGKQYNIKRYINRQWR